MRLIRNADDIFTAAQKADILGELLNGHQIDAAAFNVRQFLTEFLPVANAD